jgi:epsin
VGSENVVLYARENIYVVKTLKEFQHLEENGKDVGANGKLSSIITSN